jgi:VanZ family protein
MSAIAKYLQFWLFLLYCTYLSLTPSPNEMLIETFSDKFLHGIGYLLLLLSCNLAHHPHKYLGLKIIMLLGYSATIETIQHFIPNRGFSVGDILANLSGLLIGAILISYFRQTNGQSTQDS